MAPPQQLSHADRHAQPDALMANYTGPITRIETSANAYCPSCHHQESVRITGLDNNLMCSSAAGLIRLCGVAIARGSGRRGAARAIMTRRYGADANGTPSITRVDC
jgi:hypothetical protein